MTNPDYTAIACLMDRSGSMGPIRRDAEGAFNAFVDEQRKVAGKCTIRLAQFDDAYEVVYDSTPIADVEPYRLRPRGWTALLDGIGQVITEFGAELVGMPEAERPGKVIVVIQTDGQENSSHRYSRDEIQDLITHQRDKYGWHFVFLGANQDAIATGRGLGIPAGSSLTYAATMAGTYAAAETMSNYTTAVRSGPVGQSVSFSDEDRAAAVADA